jgi:hypothetical protein
MERRGSSFFAFLASRAFRLIYDVQAVATAAIITFKRAKTTTTSVITAAITICRTITITVTARTATCLLH